MDCRKLSDHCAALIETLAEDGISLSPVEVVELNALCWDVESPDLRLNLSRGIPVEAGGVWLWPLTLAGHVWHSEVGGRLRTDKGRRLALAYAMAHGGRVGAFSGLWNVKAATRVVKQWGGRLSCRMAVLDEAMAQLTAQDEEPGATAASIDEGASESAGVSAGEYSAMLSAMTGISPTEIESGMSFRYSLGLLEKVMAQARADGDQVNGTEYQAAERAKFQYLKRVREVRAALGKEAAGDG